jgi:hypothetical protein
VLRSFVRFKRADEVWDLVEFGVERGKVMLFGRNVLLVREEGKW